MVSALATGSLSAHHVEEEMFSMLNSQKLANALRAMDTCPEQYKPCICNVSFISYARFVKTIPCA